MVVVMGGGGHGGAHGAVHGGVNAAAHGGWHGHHGHYYWYGTHEQYWYGGQWWDGAGPCWRWAPNYGGWAWVCY